MSEKLANAIKATAIVLTVVCAGLLVATLIALAKAAKSVFLLLMAILAPFLLIGVAICLVYKYLEAR